MMAIATPPIKLKPVCIRHPTPMAALYLLLTCLLVEGSLGGLLSTSSHSTRIQRFRANTLTDDDHSTIVAASLHRSNQFGGGFIGTKLFYRRKMSSNSQGVIPPRSHLNSVLAIRGGASSSSRNNNAIQCILKSILASSSIPLPIKQLIEMVCLFIESLTGFKVLPRVNESKKKSKSNKTKSKEKALIEEAITVGKTKTSRSKSINDDKEDNEEAVKSSRKKQSKNRKSDSTTDDDSMHTHKATNSVEGVTTTSAKPDTATPTKKSSTPARPDEASKKFLSNNLKSSNPNYRIQRELKEFLSSPPPGLSVKISGKNVRLWIITLSMPENTIYAGETYKLRVQFPNDYPTSPPSVYFLPPAPRHEHVYTNGDICLSLLGTDWRPIMTAQSIAQAIMSILCGAQRKSLPMDNARHAGNKPGLKQDDWVYHDDNC